MPPDDRWPAATFLSRAYPQKVVAAHGSDRAEIARLRERAELARERASLSAARAARYEGSAVIADPRRQQLHEGLRDLYLRAETSHRMSAELHDLIATRIEERDNRPAGPSALPVVMQVVAARLRVASVVVALSGKHQPMALTAASDATARRAHDLELVLAEGPATEAGRGSLVMAAGPVLLDRWPQYGPAAAELGIHGVCAAPLGTGDAVLGALCAYDATPATVRAGGATGIRMMADALTQLLLGVADPADPDGQVRILDYFDGSDAQSVIHQAAGMVSVQCGCGIDEALDLLAARAFASGSPVRDIAAGVLDGRVMLD